MLRAENTETTMGKLAHLVPALDLVDLALALPLPRQALDQPQQLLAAASLEEIMLPQGSVQQQLPPLVLGAAHRVAVAFSAPNQLQREACSAAQQPQQHPRLVAVSLGQVILLQRQEVDLEGSATAAQQAAVSLDPRLQSPRLGSVDLELPPQQRQVLDSVAQDLAPRQPQRRVVGFSEDQVLLVPDLEPLQLSQLPRASVLARLTNKPNNQPRQVDYLAVVGLSDRTTSKSLAVCLAQQRHQQQEPVGFSASQHKHSKQAVAYLEVPSNHPRADCSERSLPLVVSLEQPLAQEVVFSEETKQHSQRKTLEACSEILSSRLVVAFLAASLPLAQARVSLAILKPNSSSRLQEDSLAVVNSSSQWEASSVVLNSSSSNRNNPRV